jgi:hypothetical protein
MAIVVNKTLNNYPPLSLFTTIIAIPPYQRGKEGVFIHPYSFIYFSLPFPQVTTFVVDWPIPH